jgi:hypothetical protein
MARQRGAAPQQLVASVAGRNRRGRGGTRPHQLDRVTEPGQAARQRLSATPLISGGQVSVTIAMRMRADSHPRMDRQCAGVADR